MKNTLHIYLKVVISLLSGPVILPKVWFSIHLFPVLLNREFYNIFSFFSILNRKNGILVYLSSLSLEPWLKLTHVLFIFTIIFRLQRWPWKYSLSFSFTVIPYPLSSPAFCFFLFLPHLFLSTASNLYFIRIVLEVQRLSF